MEAYDSGSEWLGILYGVFRGDSGGTTSYSAGVSAVLFYRIMDLDDALWIVAPTSNTFWQRVPLAIVYSYLFASYDVPVGEHDKLVNDIHICAAAVIYEVYATETTNRHNSDHVFIMSVDLQYLPVFKL
jgi:hypothetical protein